MNSTKSTIYKNIYESKFFLKVIKKSSFDIKIPRSSFDKIISLYGKESILPLSFINFCNPVENKETVINMSGSIDMRSTLQINKIMNSLNKIYIYPSSYEELSELEKMKRAPKLKSKHLKNISKKMGMDFSDMINYLSIQITTIETRESISTLKSLELYLMIFNNIHTMKVKFPDKEKFDIAYYSYKTILKKSGININKVFPFFDVNRIKDKTREEILKNEKNILYDKVVARELKEGIDEKIRQDKIDIYKGTEQCQRIPKPKYNDFEFYREKQSNILVKLSKNQKEDIIEIKKDDIINEEEKEINEKIDENKQTKDISINVEKKEDNKETVITLQKENNALDNEHNEDENKISEIKEEKKEINKKIEDTIIKKDESKNKIEEKKNVQSSIKEEENIINIKEDKNEKNINIIEQVNNDKREGNNLINASQKFASLKKGKEQQNTNDENDKSLDKKDFKANNIDLVKFMTKFNVLRKKKFKIRRAVFIKVEKDE